jgi:hypothetical protein
VCQFRDARESEVLVERTLRAKSLTPSVTMSSRGAAI